MAHERIAVDAGGPGGWGLGRSFAVFQLTAWALLSAVIVLPALSIPSLPGTSAAAWIAGWGVAGMVVSSVVAALLVHVPERWLRGVALPFILIGTAVGASAAWGASLWALEPLIGPEPWRPPFTSGNEHLALVIVRGTFVMGLWTTLFLVVLFSMRVQEARERSARAEALADQARLQLLRAQLNPHFLFNALNSVIALIEESPRAAQSMVRDVATLLRRALDADRRPQVTLDSELEFVRLYVRCEQVRFESRLVTRFEVEPGLGELLVPPMLLHPLVENAIKHGMHGAVDGPLEVTVRVARAGERLVLEVVNGGRLRAAGEGLPQGTGIGLRNVEERLRHHYPGRHVFSLAERDGTVVAHLELPAGPAEGEAPR